MEFKYSNSIVLLKAIGHLAAGRSGRLAGEGALLSTVAVKGKALR